MKTISKFVSVVVLAMIAVPAFAADTPRPAEQDWSFQGVFGTFDRAALQRGFQVYRNVCSACHAMDHLHYRDLADIGYSPAEIKAIAASVEVQDGPNDQGEMFMRPGRPYDKFKAPFPNEQAARAANGGAHPPDLSVVVKARKYGPDYVYALLTGFKKPPAGVKLHAGMHYNVAFPGHQIAMPPPLSDGSVDYKDGTKATLHQEAHDVVTFLTWASDPRMEERKRTGLKVMFFLIVASGLLFATKRRIWSDVH